MTIPFRRVHRAALTGLAVAFAAACSDPTGVTGDQDRDTPDDPTTAETAEIDFTFSRITSGTTARVAAWFASAAGSARPVSPDTIASLSITVDSIQALPVSDDNGEGEGEADDDGGWVTITLDSPVTLDLMALPTEGESPVVVASGTLAAGDYRNVRLFISDATIVFTGPISLGAAITYDADTPYEVTVPSSDQTGIKTDLAFTAEEDTDAHLLFDEGATFANVNVTGNGMVMLAPVIRAQGS